MTNFSFATVFVYKVGSFGCQYLSNIIINVMICAMEIFHIENLLHFELTTTTNSEKMWSKKKLLTQNFRMPAQYLHYFSWFNSVLVFAQEFADEWKTKSKYEMYMLVSYKYLSTYLKIKQKKRKKEFIVCVQFRM